MSAAVGSRVVLVVEDDENTRLVLGQLLETRGYEMSEAATQEAARAHLALGTPHAIILDGNVPMTALGDGQSMSTVGLARWLRERFSGLIIAFPGSQDRLDELVEVIRKGGPSAGFLKPIDIDQFLSALDQF